MQKLAFNMQVIVDSKGYIAPGLGNSGKRYNSTCKKSENQGGKRARSTKATVEHQIHEDAVECPAEIIKEAVLKYELVKKDAFKEKLKDGMVPCKSKNVSIFKK